MSVAIASLITVGFVESYNRKKEKSKRKAQTIEDLSLIIETSNRFVLMNENVENPITMEDKATDFLSKIYILFHKMRAHLGITEKALEQEGISLEEIRENLLFMRGTKDKQKIIYNIFTSLGNLFDLIHKS